MNTIGAPKTIEATTAEKKPSKEYYLEMVRKFSSTIVRKFASSKSIVVAVQGGYIHNIKLIRIGKVQCNGHSRLHEKSSWIISRRTLL